MNGTTKTMLLENQNNIIYEYYVLSVYYARANRKISQEERGRNEESFLNQLMIISFFIINFIIIKPRTEEILCMTWLADVCCPSEGGCSVGESNVDNLYWQFYC